jgi:hypothetical protein
MTQKGVRRLNLDSRVAKTARRVILMFEHYRQNINPEDDVFLEFVSHYLKRNNVPDPDTLIYSELYSHVRNAIREFLARGRYTRNQE